MVRVTPARDLIPAPVPRPADVLGFQVTSDGMSRVRLDVSLPVQRGAALLRMLLDHGLVLTGEGEP